MSEDQKNNSFILGLIIGSSMATVVTLLLSPRNGSENRQVLKKTAQALPEMAQDLSSSLEVNRHRLSQSALKKWDNTLNRLKVAIAAGIEASQNQSNLDDK
ncbi:YtxH domain-containing protein [Geminocystis sp. GBBB08]|uniref:YtxH domain-containing protein n=1 Tax=Geminocystis sp. GBBB08 TaxID=2604140 RepID=UPI0027E2A58D|nr:YtxH domain-containing protein [Geminocystis sp. GBBB08]MBL1211156.1 YtxH domain-containing protein [Geminocystis sp. GBBB08]